MASKKLRQPFIAREGLPGNVIATATLIAAANAKIRSKEPKLTPTVEQYDREVDYASLESLESLVGKVEMDASLSFELAGSNTAVTVPFWTTVLESSGFRLVTTMGSAPWSGTMTGSATGASKFAASGDIWQTAAAAKTIRIIHDTYEGRTTLYFEQLVGAAVANTDIFFPSSSDATIGPVITINGAATAAAGCAWVPNNRVIATATVSGTTGTIGAGDELRGGTSGAIIRAVAAVTDGVLRQFYLVDGTPTSTGETFTNLSQTGTTATTTGTWVTLEMPALSYGLQEDVRTKIAKGCRGSVKLSAERGKPGFFDWTGKGIYSSVGDVAAVAIVSQDAKTPPRFQGIGFQLISYTSTEPGYFNFATAHTPRVVSFSLDQNSPAVIPEDATQSNGTGPCALLVNARKGQGNMKIDTRPEGSFPAIKKMVQNEAFGLFIRFIDSTNGPNNAFLISAPGCKFSGNDVGDQNNILQDGISFTYSARRPDGTDGDNRSLVISYHYSAATAW